MLQTKTIEILEAAEQGGYGVLAAIAYNIEHIIGFVQAAEEKRSPLIIQLFPWAIHYSNGLLVHAAAQAAQKASVPIAVHLDHCQDAETVKLATTLPFDSIMVDASHHPKEDNLRITAELTQYCHEMGIATEAEPGRLEGGEDGISDTTDLSGLLTTPEEAQQFIDGGIEILAPAFGNVHGEYGPRGIVLDYDLLDRIREVTHSAGVKLALHGINRFPPELLQKLVSHGISKLNVNRDILQPYYDFVLENMGKIPFTELMERSTAMVKESMGQHMDICQSSGKAP